MRLGRNYRFGNKGLLVKAQETKDGWKIEERSPRQNLFAKGRGDRNRQPDGLTTGVIIRELAKGF